MPKYLVEQYEIHASKLLVEADSEAEAIQKVLNCDTDGESGLPEYIETCEDIGLPVEGNEELVENLESLGIMVDDFIPSIRSICEAE